MIKRLMEDLRLGWKTLRYSYGLKGNLACCILFLIVGIFFEVIGKGTTGYGAMFVFVVMLYPIQLVMSVDVSSMAQSSVYKKRLQTSAPAVVTGVVELVLYTLLVIERQIFSIYYPSEGLQWKSLAWTAIGMVVISIAMTLMYKYYTVGLIVVVLFSTLVAMITNPFMFLQEKNLLSEIKINSGIYILIGYLCVIVIPILHYSISNILYKKSLCEKSFGLSLKKKS